MKDDTPLEENIRADIPDPVAGIRIISEVYLPGVLLWVPAGAALGALAYLVWVLTQ